MTFFDFFLDDSNPNKLNKCNFTSEATSIFIRYSHCTSLYKHYDIVYKNDDSEGKPGFSPLIIKTPKLPISFFKKNANNYESKDKGYLYLSLKNSGICEKTMKLISFLKEIDNLAYEFITNDGKTKSKTENKSENKSESKSESKTESKSENKSESKTESKTESKSESEKKVDKKKKKKIDKMDKGIVCAKRDVGIKKYSIVKESANYAPSICINLDNLTIIYDNDENKKSTEYIEQNKIDNKSCDTIALVQIDKIWKKVDDDNGGNVNYGIGLKAIQLGIYPEQQFNEFLTGKNINLINSTNTVNNNLKTGKIGRGAPPPPPKTLPPPPPPPPPSKRMQYYSNKSGSSIEDQLKHISLKETSTNERKKDPADQLFSELKNVLKNRKKPLL